MTHLAFIYEVNMANQTGQAGNNQNPPKDQTNGTEEDSTKNQNQTKGAPPVEVKSAVVEVKKGHTVKVEGLNGSYLDTVFIAGIAEEVSDETVADIKKVFPTAEVN